MAEIKLDKSSSDHSDAADGITRRELLKKGGKSLFFPHGSLGFVRGNARYGRHRGYPAIITRNSATVVSRQSKPERRKADGLRSC